jgi:hypothetical protein
MQHNLCRYESAEMFWRLNDCGVPVKHLMYVKLSHADFVTGWRPLEGSKDNHQLHALAKERVCGSVSPCGKGRSEAVNRIPKSSSSRQPMTDFAEDLVDVLGDRVSIASARKPIKL